MDCVLCCRDTSLHSVDPAKGQVEFVRNVNSLTLLACVYVHKYPFVILLFVISWKGGRVGSLSIVVLLDHSLLIMEPTFLVIKVLWLSCEDTVPGIVRL